MKNQVVEKRILVVLTMILALVMNAKAQQKHLMEFQVMMAKNLYYFVCKKYSRFNPESDYRPNPAEEDIRLIPVGFVNNNWKCDTTTDPDFFWAKPEK